jgi:hypothetical protein
METPISKGQSGFWEAYRACVEENRVSPDRSPFYVNWAKTFANFIPKKSLKERTGKDIEAFLSDLAKRSGIADWQVQQAKHPNGARTVGTRQCHHHHDLYPRPEQARALRSPR